MHIYIFLVHNNFFTVAVETEKTASDTVTKSHSYATIFTTCLLTTTFGSWFLPEKIYLETFRAWREIVAMRKMRALRNCRRLHRASRAREAPLIRPRELDLRICSAGNLHKYIGCSFGIANEKKSGARTRDRMRPVARIRALCNGASFPA